MHHAALLAAFRFETPAYLVLLAIIPLLIVMSIRSLAGLGGVRRVLALLLRSLVILCMILALANAQWVKVSDKLSVIFLLDRSSSVPRAQQQEAFAFISASQTGLQPTRDRLGVIAFDGHSAVEQLPMAALAIDRISEPTQRDRTNVAGALRMALALFTEDTARRVVLLSDGNENVGEALREAEHFSAAGVPIDVFKIGYEHENEVVFERLSAPATATSEETVNLQMVLRSQKRVSGRILLFQNDTPLDLDPDSAGTGWRVTLEPGPNRFTRAVPLRVAGAHRFRAEFHPDDPAADTLPGNNAGRAFTIVSGQGRILILHQGMEEETISARVLEAALEKEKLVCETAVVGSAQISQEFLAGYSLLILSNVPAHLFTEAERKNLSVYVRDLGGGLVMVGGDSAFGAGGWMDTPVEDVMPVSFDIKSKKQIPKGALALVMHGCEIPQGNYWAERVAIAAVKSLSSRDLIGVLSYNWKGSDAGNWDVPLQPVGNKARIIQGIKKLAHGDLPDLDPIMRQAVDALADRPDAAAKHMIVLSDFDPQAPRQDLINKMRKYKITCSTVAIGFGAHPIDTNLAKWIADSTGGKAYTTKDYSKLPQIFMKEAQIVRRSLIQEQMFTPRLASTLPSTVAGLAGEALPQLGGYVLTTAKPVAQVTLVHQTEEGPDPILAQWQVGLGKAVAFTSGMWPRWGADWAQWPKFSKLWAQIARWASRQSAAAAFDVSTTVRGGVGRIRVEALDTDASALNQMSIVGTLVNPDADARPLQLTQVGPGQYEAEFDARQAGSYVMSLGYRIGGGAEAVQGTLQTGLAVAYSPEYRRLRTNDAILNELAERTGGRVLNGVEAASVFDRTDLRAAEARSAIWENLVRWMLLLFLLDVAIRRIAFHPREAARKMRRFINELAGRHPEERSAAVLSTLKGTRDRVREALPGAKTEGGPAPQRSARYEGPLPDAKATEALRKALDGASELEAPVVARPTRKQTPTTEADFTSRLLKAKKKARDEMKEDE